jgi:tetratricopeptide (TPR) repeat protein
MKKNLLSLVCSLILLATTSLSAQNKDIEKGKEKLKDAFNQKDAAKKNETIQKAVELFQKGGMKKEMFVLLGDAFLAHGDLSTAETKYGQADKADKAEGYYKVGLAYVEQAMSEEKQETKLLDKAMKDFTKAGKMKEGASVIGDKFFERGEKYYAKSVDYYLRGNDTASVVKIAEKYEAQGGEGVSPAIDLYKKGGKYKKAGDLAWDSKQYTKAFDAYSSGEVTEGMRKCADMFFELGQVNESQNIYLKMVDAFTKTANTEAIEKLATENVKIMNYALASKIYDKAGNLNSAKKYYAYSKIKNMQLDSAKILLNQNDEPALAKAIDANMKYLNPLKDVKDQFDDYVKQQPAVSTELDPVTNKYRPTPKDEQILVDYYKLIKDQIADGCAVVAKNAPAITNAELKKMVMAKFLEFPAISKILDPNSFALRLSKSSAQVKDVYLKKI